MAEQVRMRALRNLPSYDVKAGETFDVSDDQSGRLRAQGLAKRLGPVSEFTKAGTVRKRAATNETGRTADQVEGRAASELDPETRANANARTPGGGPSKAADTAATPRTSQAGGPTKPTRQKRTSTRAMTTDDTGTAPKTRRYNRRDMRAK